MRRKPDARTCLIQVRIARRRGDFGEVENKLQQAIRLGAPRSEVQRENWIAMAQSQQFDAMQSHWTELLQDARDDEPEIAKSYYSWAMLHHHLDLARKTLESWIQDFPQDAEPHFLLGRYHQAGPNWEAAEKAYRQSLDLAPGRDDARLALAIALQARLKTNEAIPLFEACLRKHPDELAAVMGLAQCLTSNGNVDSATKLLRQAAEKNPNDATIQKAYGELLLSSGSSMAAADILEKAYRATPENANLANVLARAWKACGRKSDAEPLLAFVAESRPELDQLLVIEKELRAQPNNLELRMKVAAITAKYVSRQDGIRWYQQVVKISPKYLPAHKALAELYQLIGETKLAEYHGNITRQGSP
jgi:tetratricopeptide (TPR) repeat protein